MKTHFSEEIEDTAQFNKTAGESTWQQKRVSRAVTVAEIATVLVLGIAFFGLLLLMQVPPAPPLPIAVQSMELPPRPIWVNNLPYAPRDGHSLQVLVPLQGLDGQLKR
jgi:hypothetical protein